MKKTRSRKSRATVPLIITRIIGRALLVDFLNMSVYTTTRLERVVADGTVCLVTVALVPVDRHVGDETPKIYKKNVRDIVI